MIHVIAGRKYRKSRRPTLGLILNHLTGVRLEKNESLEMGRGDFVEGVILRGNYQRPLWVATRSNLGTEVRLWGLQMLNQRKLEGELRTYSNSNTRTEHNLSNDR